MPRFSHVLVVLFAHSQLLIADSSARPPRDYVMGDLYQHEESVAGWTDQAATGGTAGARRAESHGGEPLAAIVSPEAVMFAVGAIVAGDNFSMIRGYVQRSVGLMGYPRRRRTSATVVIRRCRSRATGRRLSTGVRTETRGQSQDDPFSCPYS